MVMPPLPFSPPEAFTLAVLLTSKPVPVDIAPELVAEVFPLTVMPAVAATDPDRVVVPEPFNVTLF